ncbi:MAG: hypothetical protein AMJ59_13705 [Gammaproteobacteria bacterium SG8_31]|jgi:hypothetical protein|nr:MAG: hypothetical protein AMJ59_13705 [Gammaproteobacteria bacterium SG8_31]
MPESGEASRRLAGRSEDRVRHVPRGGSEDGHGQDRLKGAVITATIAALPLFAWSAAAESDRWTFGVSGTGVYQAGAFDDTAGATGQNIGDTSRGSLAIDLDGTLRTSDHGRLHAAASFAEGNGLDGTGGVSVRVNADDLEDDLQDINGRGRDYLREAWYGHGFDLGGRRHLDVTGGIIDATRYIDTNRVANDENRQFMNEVFVNRCFLPSYDPGIAVSLMGQEWTAHGVWMNTRAESATGGYQGFDFFAVDLETRYRLSGDEGNLRWILLTTSDSFGTDKSAVHGGGISADQEFGDYVLAFARMGIFSDEPSVLVHKALYSGGLQLSGGAFGHPRWVVGVGYAFLDGVGDSPGDVLDTRVWEGYARWNPRRRFGLSLDVQHVSDSVRQDADPELWAIGVRLFYVH